MEIQLIGCGNMGESFLKLILQTDTTQKQISILETYQVRNQELKKLYPDIKLGINPNANIIILATKPQQIKEIDFSIFHKDSLIISMLAGISTKTIHLYSQINNIVRCMPNLAVSIGQGTGGYYSFDTLKQKHKDFIKSLFHKLGYFIPVQTEDMIDKITAISGSGPAYFLYFTQLLTQQAQNMGFDPHSAQQLAEQTFIGTANLLKNNDLSAKELKNKVTSKGGTTESALKSFQKNALEKIINEATNSAYKKAKILTL